MNILALEFSSPQRSVAIVRLTASNSSLSTAEVIESSGRAINACTMIEGALAQGGLEREQIERIAIGVGPGSYTGIRAAIAFAQGWQLARGVKLVAISSVEVMAAQAGAEGVFGKVAIVVDAQRQEFYLQTFQTGPGQWNAVDAMHLASANEVQLAAQSGARLAGPALSGAFKDAVSLYPSAAMLGKLALNATEIREGNKIEPIYLRETQFVKLGQPARAKA